MARDGHGSGSRGSSRSNGGGGGGMMGGGMMGMMKSQISFADDDFGYNTELLAEGIPYDIAHLFANQNGRRKRRALKTVTTSTDESDED